MEQRRVELGAEEIFRDRVREALIVVVCAAIVIGMALLGGCGGGQGNEGNTCNFPTLVQSDPDSGDSLFLCGDGDVLECRSGSCTLGGGNAGNPTTNSGNTTDSENPVDSNNRTTITNPTPTPTPRFGG